MATRTFGDVSFRRVAVIELETDGKGQIVQDSHALPRHVQLNRHAAGPFCRLRIGPLPTSSGVYAIVVGEEVKYVGRCEDLAQRFGPRGYGVIHPRNLHRDGQSANCKINSRILTESRAGHSIAIFFHESADHYRAIEAELISILAPPWNDRRERVTRLSESAGKVKTPALGRRDGVHKERFAAGLNDEFRAATALGHSFVRINAGEFHSNIGGYPGPDHRMPSCCAAMCDAMRSHDRVIDTPPKGKGARLTIEYRLPR